MFIETVRTWSIFYQRSQFVINIPFFQSFFILLLWLFHNMLPEFCMPLFRCWLKVHWIPFARFIHVTCSFGVLLVCVMGSMFFSAISSVVDLHRFAQHQTNLLGSLYLSRCKFFVIIGVKLLDSYFHQSRLEKERNYWHRWSALLQL